jgi:SecD/SecF fusion protein
MALLLNMMMLMAAMIMIKAAFTLPGFAGLALTIGMAVDANVLIYERFREELDRQASLRMVIRNGFAKAQSAIIDSNLTTLISAAVLWIVGTDQIKGFAVTLFLGVAINIFAAVYCSHVVFDVAERQRWISRLGMQHLFGKTNFDFWSLRYYCYTISIVLGLLGIIAIVARGQSMLDIDFRGGVLVEVALKEARNIEDVRRELRDLPDLSVSDVHRPDEAAGMRFMINTASPPDEDATAYRRRVEDEIRRVFGDQLIRNEMQIKDVHSIGAAKVSRASPAPARVQTALPPPTMLASNDPAAVMLALGQNAASSDAKPAEAAPAEAKPTETKPAETKPAEPAPAEAKPADAKPAEPKPAEATAPEAKPAESKPAEAAPAEAKPMDAATASKPAEAAPAETKPAEAKPAEPAAATPPAAPASAAAPAPAPAAAPVAVEKQPVESATESSQATLDFRFKLDHESVVELVTKAMETSGVIAHPVDFTVTNPNYQPGETSGYASWTVKVKLPPEQASKLLDAVKAQVDQTPYFPSSNTIGAKVAGDTRIRGVYAMIASWALITLYLWVRFQRVSYGLAAVVALIHDSIITVGMLAGCYFLLQIPGLSNLLGALQITEFKFGLTELAAVLTLIGYSVNDTVVVYDRIREVRGKSPLLTPEMINTSINQTLSRTILTAFTVFLVVAVLYILGGPTIHGFAFLMLIGVISGTISSIYVAAPLLLLGQHKPTAQEVSRTSTTRA